MPPPTAPNIPEATARILLAPMHGLADHVLRGVLTRQATYGCCVSEFVRVTGSLLPVRTYERLCPELAHNSRTAAGTPLRVQLLGSDPAWLALNAARLVTLKPAGIDLNFGCPAPTVNRHRGGAILLDEPELLYRIVRAVRAVIPKELPFSAKMRLGVNDAGRALEAAGALVQGGVDELVVHGRTKADGYRPPARWEAIARIREAVPVPVIANGEIWKVADYWRCRDISGCRDVMLGRGAVCDPLLPQRILGHYPDIPQWADLQPGIRDFWDRVQQHVLPVHAPGRLKQWLALLARTCPEAGDFYRQLRHCNTAAAVDALLYAHAVCPSPPGSPDGSPD